MANATAAAISSNVIVNAIWDDAPSTSCRSVRTCASASERSTVSTARLTGAVKAATGARERMTYVIALIGGPSMAMAGMSGPPASDIGMYTTGTGVVSVSAWYGVLETTPTILSHGGAPFQSNVPLTRRAPGGGGALERSSRPIGFSPRNTT